MTRRGRILLSLAGVIVLVLVAGQFVLPRIAERVVRSQLGDPTAEVHVSSFPAWEMAFGHVDRIRLRARGVDKDGDGLRSLLDRAKGVGSGDATIDSMRVGQVRLHDVRATLDHGRLRASTRLVLGELSAMVPGGGSLDPLPSGPSGQPRFLARVSVLGLEQAVPVTIAAVNGSVEAAPEGGLASAFRLTVFSNPGLRIDSVRGGSVGRDVRLSVTGELR